MLMYRNKNKSKEEWFDIPEDPNDPDEEDIPNIWKPSRKLLHKNLSIQELIRLVESEPEEYVTCLFKRKSWYEGIAIVLDRDDIEQINLPTTNSCGRAFDDDTVVVKITDTNKKKLPFVYYGKVEGILERAENLYEKRFVCRLDDTSCTKMVPIDNEMVRFFIKSPRHQFKSNKVYVYKRENKGNEQFSLKEKPDRFFENANPNDLQRVVSKLFTVRFINWSMYHWNPFGYVEGLYGEDKDIIRFKVMYGVSGLHGTNLNIAASKFINTSLKWQTDRKDLTNLFVFTIDDDNSKVLDDAFSIEKCSHHKNCWKVGIHISDVASFVEEGGKVDEEAKKRQLSTLREKISGMSDEDGHMLPPSLRKTCSLTSDENERFAVSTFFHASSSSPSKSSKREKPGSETSTSSDPILSRIKPRRNLTYSEAQEMLNKQHCKEFVQGTMTNLPQQLHFLWKVMWNIRVQRMDTAAFHREIENKDHPLEKHRQKCIARMMVEEAMITLNEFVANFFKARKIPFVARTQPPPSIDQPWAYSPLSLYQKSWSKFFKVKSPRSEIKEVEKEKVTTMAVQPELWKEISSALDNGNVEEAVVLACCDDVQPDLANSVSQFQFIQERFDLKQSWCTDDLSHFGLRLDAYVQCSSPIRKYMDLVTQRNLIKFLKGKEVDEIDREVFQNTSFKENKAFEFAKTVSHFEKFKECPASYYAAFIVEANDIEIVVNFPLCFGMDKRHIVFFSDLIPQKKTRSRKNVKSTGIKHTATHLEWAVRYYDESTQTHALGFKKTKTVNIKEWKAFLHCLESDPFMEKNRTPLAEALKRFVRAVVATRTADNGLADVDLSRTSSYYGGTKLEDGHKILIHIASKNFRRRFTRKSNEKVAMTMKDKASSPSSIKRTKPTSNGIYHGQEVKINITPYYQNRLASVPLYFQIGSGLKNGVRALVPQLLHLTSDIEGEESKTSLDICLSHRRNITMFDFSHKEGTLTRGHFERQDNKLWLYYEKWLPLVRMDGIYSSIHSNATILLQLDSVTFSSRDLKGHFTLRKEFCESCFVEIKKGDFLCFRERVIIDEESGEFRTWIAHGVVNQVPPRQEEEEKAINTFGFTLFKSLEMTPRKDGQHGFVLCEIIPMSVPHRRMCSALNNLHEDSLPELVKAICLDDHQYSIQSLQLENEYYVKERITKLKIGERVVGQFSKKLNDKQVEQVKKALGKPVTLIQGPPGTGKSFMGAHLAYYFHELNKQLKKSGKILYCGPSNKSVDVVAEYLRRIPSLKIVRVYGSMIEERDFPIPIKPSGFQAEEVPKIADSLKEVALHHVIRRNGKPSAEELHEFDRKCKVSPNLLQVQDYKKYQKTLKEAKVEELKESTIILCTCAVAGSSFMSKIEFAQCVIDECGMCTEPECLIPIMAAAKNENVQVTLIGDHKQLEPIILCRHAAREGLQIPLFERLKKNAQKLTLQYRMHPTICKFVSEQFYEGELQNDVSVHKRSNVALVHPQNKEQNPTLFFHVDGEEDEDETKSKYNIDQAKLVIKVLHHLESKQVQSNEIMVLSPYLAQCRQIKKLLNSEKFSHFDKTNLHVGSVVTSQGSEADYVILSTVRSSYVVQHEGEVDRPWLFKKIGFVSDDHQINVALSRAKLGLRVIGNKHLLKKHSTWKNLISEYERRGAVRDESPGTSILETDAYVDNSEDDYVYDDSDSCCTDESDSSTYDYY